MATVTKYLQACDFSAWCNGGEDYATMNTNNRNLKGQFAGAGLDLSTYKITAIGIYGEYRRNTLLTYPMGNTNRGATLYNGSSISSIGSAVSSQEDGDSKMSKDYAPFTNYYTTDANIINSLVNQINSGLVVTIDLHADNKGGNSQYYIYGKNIRLEVTYEEKPQATITVNTNNSSYGYTTGGGTYYNGATATLTATPKSGYKFASWNDGNTSATRTVTVTGNATYTAYFVPVYVIYDSIFSFKRWADTNLVSWTLMNISNVTDTGFTGTSLVDDAYTLESQPLIPVEQGKQYIVAFDRSQGGHELFVFHCDASGAWGELDYLGDATLQIFTAKTNYISIRVDIVGAGREITFSNFRIYPYGYEYMKDSVPAAERTDVASWSMPTPTRAGYNFLGWNTKPDGSGTTYTSSSAFPTDDLILYSQWKANNNKIVITDSSGIQSDCIGVYVQPSTKTIIYKTQGYSSYRDGEGADTVGGWHIKIRGANESIFQEAGIYEVSEIYKNGERFY